MRVETAAAYCDEPSVKAFRASVGGMWPAPMKWKGKSERWLKDDLDRAIEALTAAPEFRSDLSDVF